MIEQEGRLPPHIKAAREHEERSIRLRSGLTGKKPSELTPDEQLRFGEVLAYHLGLLEEDGTIR